MRALDVGHHLLESQQEKQASLLSKTVEAVLGIEKNTARSQILWCDVSQQDDEFQRFLLRHKIIQKESDVVSLDRRGKSILMTFGSPSQARQATDSWRRISKMGRPYRTPMDATFSSAQPQVCYTKRPKLSSRSHKLF